MLLNLTANEVRVLGCLMEKSLTTPDHYPLTLNALTNACNQKSSREPVTSLDQGTVERTARDLEMQKLVRIEENFKRGVKKYKHSFYGSIHGNYKFEPAQFAILCLLFLRGPQTPGELKSRSGRLHEFADNNAVQQTLDSMMEEDREPLVVKLPRTPGRKDSEFMHLFSGAVDLEAYSKEALEPRPADIAKHQSIAQLEERITALETEVAELKSLVINS